MFSGWGWVEGCGGCELLFLFSGGCCEGGPLKHKWALCNIAPGVLIKVNGGAAGCRPWFVAARVKKEQKPTDDLTPIFYYCSLSDGYIEPCCAESWLASPRSRGFHKSSMGAYKMRHDQFTDTEFTWGYGLCRAEIPPN